MARRKKLKRPYVELLEVFKNPKKLFVDKTGETGKVIYGAPLTFYPGKKYDLPVDDKARMKSLEDQKVSELYTAKREEWLKENNIEYKITQCKTCGGGRGRKLIFNPLGVHIYE